MGKRAIRLPASAEAQVADALLHTLSAFGRRKFEEYSRLIEAALAQLAEDACVGTSRPDIGDGAWLYPIAHGGAKARHVFLYRFTADEVQLVAFLYDGMDLPSHWDD